MMSILILIVLYRDSDSDDESNPESPSTDVSQIQTTPSEPSHTEGSLNQRPLQRDDLSSPERLISPPPATTTPPTPSTASPTPNLPLHSVEDSTYSSGILPQPREGEITAVSIREGSKQTLESSDASYEGIIIILRFIVSSMTVCRCSPLDWLSHSPEVDRQQWTSTQLQADQQGVCKLEGYRLAA